MQCATLAALAAFAFLISTRRLALLVTGKLVGCVDSRRIGQVMERATERVMQQVKATRRYKPQAAPVTLDAQQSLPRTPPLFLARRPALQPAHEAISRRTQSWLLPLIDQGVECEEHDKGDTQHAERGSGGDKSGRRRRRLTSATTRGVRRTGGRGTGRAGIRWVRKGGRRREEGDGAGAGKDEGRAGREEDGGERRRAGTLCEREGGRSSRPDMDVHASRECGGRARRSGTEGRTSAESGLGEREGRGGERARHEEAEALAVDALAVTPAFCSWARFEARARTYIAECARREARGATLAFRASVMERRGTRPRLVAVRGRVLLERESPRRGRRRVEADAGFLQRDTSRECALAAACVVGTPRELGVLGWRALHVRAGFFSRRTAHARRRLRCWILRGSGHGDGEREDAVELADAEGLGTALREEGGADVHRVLEDRPRARGAAPEARERLEREDAEPEAKGARSAKTKSTAFTVTLRCWRTRKKLGWRTQKTMRQSSTRMGAGHTDDPGEIKMQIVARSRLTSTVR
ncbi:hypothetical protein DFH09DRAFT_1083953 [Mycena vulgaris]|nr:hypothetical protein DFH09DRAFT_1083953 [Mycena vulgaris]